MGYTGAGIGGTMGSFWGYPEGNFRGTLRVNLDILFDHLGGSLGSLGEYFWGILGNTLRVH